MRPRGTRAVLGKAAAAAPSVSATTTALEESYAAAPAVNGYKTAGPVVMESIQVIRRTPPGNVRNCLL